MTDLTAHPGQQVFHEHRRLLFSVAYRLLGTAADAEDVVQDAWIKWSAADRSQVADPKAYLTRIVSNLALEQLRSTRHKRETYVGPWLPEPILTGGDASEAVTEAESVSMAMLVVLETLSPLERAVFVLGESSASATPRSPGRWSVPKPRCGRRRTGPASTYGPGGRVSPRTGRGSARPPSVSSPPRPAGTSTP
ncbi:hypothetical protein SUDANB145_00019 [Streptomyces sp. enrichment culture]